MDRGKGGKMTSDEKTRSGKKNQLIEIEKDPSKK